MTFTVLIVIGIAQFGFAALLAVFLFVHRAGAERHTREEALGIGTIEAPLRKWLVGEGDISGVCEALDTLPHEAARLTALRVGREMLDREAGAALAEALRGRAWVTEGFDLALSPWWWRRLEAARLIADLGTNAQELVVRRLLVDVHPAVRIAATNCLRRIANPGLIETVLNELPHQPIAVRSTQMSLLRAQWRMARTALLERLNLRASPVSLTHWISVAEVLELPEVLAEVVQLHQHPVPQVRMNVARAMKKYFHADAPRVLRILLDDPDWRVRAQAARSLGVLHELTAVPALARRLGDPAWWVRFRSGLALSQLGEPGRAALRAARASPDQYQSQMATMVSGLSAGSVVELVEG